MDDIEGNLNTLSGLLLKIPKDDPRMPLIYAGLGMLYEARFDRIHEPSDIDKAIENASLALGVTADGDPDRLERVGLLGRSHTKRYHRFGDVNDSEKAIEYETIAMNLSPDSDPDLPPRLANLGAAHSDRYKRLGELHDLEKSIEYESRAVKLTPNDHPHLPTFLSNLGVAHNDRYQRLGELDDLEKAMKYGSRGVELTPGDHPELPMRLANLGVAYNDQYQRLGELDHLEKAIEYGARAVELTPEGQPSLPMRLANLGATHSDRYKRLGDLRDLEKSVKFESRAVTLTPVGHPDLPIRLANLGVAYSDRYERLGGLGDLDKAIEYAFRAVALTSEGDPHLPVRLASLGVSHAIRFQRLGELHDLEKSIDYNIRAVELTPEGHPDLPIRLFNLGQAQVNRYRRLEGLQDLQQSIENETRAVSLTPDGHPNLSMWLANLGMTHSNRYKRLGEPYDLEKSIEYESRAVELAPKDHPNLPTFLINLGVAHGDRYRRLGETIDIERANECESRALSLMPDGHPDLSWAHFNYALSILAQYERTSDASYLQASLESFRRASKTSTGSPRVKFQNAYHWAKRATNHPSLDSIEAYQTTIDLLPQFVWLGATNSQRYQDLETIETLAVDAACAAICSSNYSLALEWLEHARCVVWNQSLMLRSPVDQLQADHPTLAARLQDVSSRIHSASTHSRESQTLSSGSLTIEQVAQEHRQLAMEYDELITQARQLPGFADFLRPMKAASLVHAARYGPVAVINCNENRCDALLILPGKDEIQHIPLPGFTGEDAKLARLHMRKSLSSKGIRERGVKHKQKPGHVQEDNFGRVLATLWYKIVKPVLDFLGYTNNTQSDNLPHITWCPTGVISFLPLHAAGDYDQPRSRVFDYVVSSYTPTVSALLSSTPTTLTPSSTVLAIGQEVTPGFSPLPETARELEYIQAHVQNTAQYTQLSNSQATTSAVLDAMEAHDWVHLACHAHQNVKDATKSGFSLHDGTLDLATINQGSFKNKGLAFLSACQTAKGDEELPDEAIHLASGMLMAGYSSVIATMWSVFDADAPLVTDKVYKQLVHDRSLGNGEAGKALHSAVADLRGRVGEKAFERWVPYIHIGS